MVRFSSSFAFPLLLLLGMNAGCESEPTPPPSVPHPVEPPAPPPRPSATAAETVAAATPDAGAPAEPEAPKPWEGPFLGVLRSSTGIYAQPSFRREFKIGYAEEGARVPVHPDPVDGDGCGSGWYRVVHGGYICGGHGTTKLDDPRLRNGRRRPNLDEILPYKYARNTANGTPLYRSVPSSEQIRKYEPYRFKDEPKAPSKGKAAKPSPAPKQDDAVDERTRQAREDQARRMAALRAARRAMLGEAAAKKLEAAEAVQPASLVAGSSPDAGGVQKEWWEDENANLHELTLQDLQAQDSPVLAQRMVKGFYIAVDRQFEWNKRQWYRSTKGLVAPVDRFHAAPGPTFKGVELSEEWSLPIGWVYGWNKSRAQYRIDPETKVVRRSGSLTRFSAVNLTGEELEVGKTTYVAAADGFWMRKRDLRIARPGSVPADLRPDERWLDVNITTQTVILFEGTRPLYATLISSGKKHNDPKRDHSTPTGEWRIETKHITATMDGDGSASDLPYSIEAVPYVMYYHKSYAVHGAFWHQNYGVRMSHGCVNLSPLDAKYIFFNTDPPVHEGWHGAWSSADRPGSRVVIHE